MEQKQETTKPMVSVVTICYNARAGIEKTMQSVLDQTYGGFEYIVKDGGSTDGTQELIAKYEPEFRRRGIPFEYVSTKDHGIYDAMNQATAMASGRWVNYMNSDDCFASPHVLQNIFGEKQWEADILYGDSISEYTFGKGIKEYTLWKGRETGFETMPFCHQACFLPVEWMKKYPYDESYGSAADYHAILRLYKEKASFANTGEVICVVTMDGVSNMNMKNSFQETIRIKRELHLEELLGSHLGLSTALVNGKQWILGTLPKGMVNRLIRLQIHRREPKIYTSVQSVLRDL